MADAGNVGEEQYKLISEVVSSWRRHGDLCRNAATGKMANVGNPKELTRKDVDCNADLLEPILVKFGKSTALMIYLFFILFLGTPSDTMSSLSMLAKDCAHPLAFWWKRARTFWWHADLVGNSFHQVRAFSMGFQSSCHKILSVPNTWFPII